MWVILEWASFHIHIHHPLYQGYGITLVQGLGDRDGEFLSISLTGYGGDSSLHVEGF